MKTRSLPAKLIAVVLVVGTLGWLGMRGNIIDDPRERDRDDDEVAVTYSANWKPRGPADITYGVAGVERIQRDANPPWQVRGTARRGQYIRLVVIARRYETLACWITVNGEVFEPETTPTRGRPCQVDVVVR